MLTIDKGKYMNINTEFINKFNKLDQLCQQLYNKSKKNGFDALKHFAQSLEGNNKNTLLNLIKARNMLVHNDINIINIKKDALEFLQGLIDGINRKIHNGYAHTIDSELENLRTSNLKKMSNTNQLIIKKYKFLSNSALNEISNDLKYYIDQERKANTLESIKNIYFQFQNCVDLIENRPYVKEARQLKKQTNFAKVKNEALQTIELLYCDVINETHVLNIILRNRAKLIKKSAIEAINNCTTINQINNIIELYEEKFEDLFD